MKALKIILITIVVLFGAIFILAFIAPKEMTVERSVTIEAPKSVVMDYVVSMKKMQEWSPWADYDPNMTVTYEGPETGVGAASVWEGNEEVGKGRQEITAVTEERVETKIQFIEPWESESDAYIQMNETDSGTNVTWGFTSETPVPMNVFMLFMDMDAAVGKDFENGLAKLEALSEAQAGDLSSQMTYTPEEVTYPGNIFIAKKDTVMIDDMKGFFEQNAGMIYQKIQEAGHQPSGTVHGIYYYWNPEEGKTYMAVAVPVSDSTASIEGLETLKIVESKALHIPYMGSYENMEAPHMSMDQYMKEKNLHLNEVVIEEYVTDPQAEPDTSKWLTNIYYLVQE